MVIQREIELAFIKLHILYHAVKEEVYGLGLIEELKRHGYRLGPGTLYPTLAKMERSGLLTSEKKNVNHKIRKYYSVTSRGKVQLDKIKPKVEELYREIVKDG